VGGVFVLIVLGILLLAALAWGGVRLLLAGRELDEGTRGSNVPVAPRGSLADKVDRRLHQTRVTLETLVMPEVEEDELAPSIGAYRHRAQTYLVLGAGLVGLAACLLIGILLVL
jgi:hypothetical protein